MFTMITGNFHTIMSYDYIEKPDNTFFILLGKYMIISHYTVDTSDPTRNTIHINKFALQQIINCTMLLSSLSHY